MTTTITKLSTIVAAMAQDRASIFLRLVRRLRSPVVEIPVSREVVEAGFVALSETGLNPFFSV